MGKTCVAANCTNRSDTEKDVSFHVFPAGKSKISEARRAQWIRQVQRTRACWKGPTSIHTFVCSDHFTPDCYELRPQLKQEMGFSVSTLRRLKSDAVPTIFIRSEEERVTPKRARTAFQKRERMRLVNETLNESSSAGTIDVDEVDSATGMETESSSATAMETDSCDKKNTACQTVPVIVKKNSKKIQATIKCGKTKQTQTDILKTADMSVQAGNGVLHNLDDSMSSSVWTAHDDVSNYIPSIDSENEADGDDAQFNIPQMQPAVENTNFDALNHPKFIIFWSSLQMILSWIHCPSCQSHEVITSRCSDGPTLGTLLRVQIFCENCGKMTHWKSQPYINDYPAGNVLLSAAILFSGSICSKVLLLFKHMRLWGIEKSTFFRHQKELLFPAINSVWNRHQQNLIGLLRARNDGVVIGGDGRADSMGHCAKYGTYTCIELLWNCIIDIKLVTSSEVGGSYHMELEGLKRSLEYLSEWLDIKKIVTDRHRQIAKWMRENHSGILHLYDIWHVAKGVGKKLEAAAKLKECQDIRPWIQSIVNHLYWSAISTTPGEGEVIVAKWASVINHVMNIHKHNNPHFSSCMHGQLEGREARKKWLQRGSKSAIQVEGICLRKLLLADIARLSGEQQTWNLEAFHSLLNQFAPKMISFSPIGMECRVKIAALHYNENAGRPQHVTSEGTPSFQIRYPKYKKGGYIVRKILEDKTYGYVDELYTQVITECSELPVVRKRAASAVVLPPTLCAEFVHPNREEAIREHNTRYQQKK